MLNVGSLSPFERCGIIKPDVLDRYGDHRMALLFLALLWVGFLALVARADGDGQKLILLGGWSIMIVGSIIGIGQAIF